MIKSKHKNITIISNVETFCGQLNTIKVYKRSSTNFELVINKNVFMDVFGDNAEKKVTEAYNKIIDNMLKGKKIIDLRK